VHIDPIQVVELGSVSVSAMTAHQRARFLESFEAARLLAGGDDVLKLILRR